MEILAAGEKAPFAGLGSIRKRRISENGRPEDDKGNRDSERKASEHGGGFSVDTRDG